ncbi:MAG: hypothetical protein [Microvirus sp.]|nr:MAG: hypothetical protein [Microvirus sp.]
MRRGIATPEKNNGKKLTIPVKTRTPLEAFKMLAAGQPVDVAAGVYDDQGILPGSFYMMDTTAKLHALANIRQERDYYKNEISNLSKQYQDEQNQAAAQQAAQAPTL